LFQARLHIPGWAGPALAYDERGGGAGQQQKAPSQNYPGEAFPGQDSFFQFFFHRFPSITIIGQKRKNEPQSQKSRTNSGSKPHIYSSFFDFFDFTVKKSPAIKPPMGLNLTHKILLAGERPPSVLGSVVFLMIFVTSTKAKQRFAPVEGI
jgi:hypothetical protein